MQRDCCILNGGGGAWAFAPLAAQLSRALWIDVAAEPRRLNYLLLADDEVLSAGMGSFVPLAAITAASDKRILATVFAAAGVPTPDTRLVASVADAERLLDEEPDRQWCLKYPTGCGAAGHRMLSRRLVLPRGWPTPLVVQEFVPLGRPEVFRTYGAGGEVFGWTARRYPAGATASPWVAHVRGARYENAGEIPPAAADAARKALAAADLLQSFGCVDLISPGDGVWLVLEVGTDGLFNHVDRDLGDPYLEQEIQKRIADAFWSRFGLWRPWSGEAWHPRPTEVA